MEEAEFKIRLMQESDLPALEWDGEFTHFRLIYESVFKRMKRGSAMAWVAENAGKKIVGQVFLQLDCDRPELADGWSRAYLFSFRIKPEYRNREIGTRMVAVLENFLRERKFRSLTLNVARNNPDAIRLYERLGFKIVAPEPGIWSYVDHKHHLQTVEEPSWRMEKLLKATPDPRS
jgi:ribosomal protein S18 acetylase RimI-like enzyme